jgi:hypothetical protein
VAISSDERLKIRGALHDLGYTRTAYTSAVEEAGTYAETWSKGIESLDITWSGYRAEAVTDVRTEDKSEASPGWTEETPTPPTARDFTFAYRFGAGVPRD